jgi:hypothetical protein
MYEITYDKDIFRNCLEVIRTEDSVQPVRFTPNQFSVYSKNEGYRIRSYCPAGINIDFKTDSKKIYIEYYVCNQSRNWMCFDVFINDIFVESIGKMPIECADGEIRFNIPEQYTGLNRITIYLPHLVELKIKRIALEDDSKLEYVDTYKKNLLSLGDSITQGMDAYHPASAYPVALSRFLGTNLINQGVGGFYFEAESLDEHFPYRPDIITVAYGTNDWKWCNNKEEFVDKCSDYINLLVKYFNNSKIYVITPLWRKDLNEKYNVGSFYELDDVIRKVCYGYEQITIINGMEIIPHMPEYMGDGRVHPNDEGFLHMTLNLAKVIK